MVYTPTTWIDDVPPGSGTPLDAAHLNKIEQGIVTVDSQAAAGLSALDGRLDTAEGQIVALDGRVDTLEAGGGDLVLPGRLFAHTSASGGVAVTDWNQMVESGWAQGQNATNAPKVGFLLGFVVAYQADYLMQEVWEFDVPMPQRHWRRTKMAGNWSSWEQTWPIVVDVDTSLTACRVRSSVSQTLPFQQWTGITYNVEEYDPSNMHAPGSDSIVVTTAGLYQFSFGARTTGGMDGVRLLINGVVATESIAAASTINFSKVLSVPAGGSVSVQFFNGASSTNYQTVVDPSDPSLALVRIA